MRATARTMCRTSVMFGVALFLWLGSSGSALAQRGNGAIISPIPIPAPGGATPEPAPAPAAPSPYDDYSQQPANPNPESIGNFPRPTGPGPFPTRPSAPAAAPPAQSATPAQAPEPAEQDPAAMPPIPNADRIGTGPANAPTPNPGTPQTRELSYATHLDRTAVWLGDQFHYRILVDHAANIQFVVENLNRETVNLDPLRVIDVRSSTAPLRDGRQRLIVDLTLSYLTAGLNEVQIPQLSLFYFRRDGTTTSSEGAAAESVTIPGPMLGIRSALVGDPELRDAATVSPWPQQRQYVAWAGWLALFLLVSGGAWEGALMMRRRKTGAVIDPRKQMALIRERWSNEAPGAFGNADVVMDFYGRTYRDLKEYVGYMMETPTEGLLAGELREEMARRGAGPEVAEKAARVLETCERARYARNPTDLDAEKASAVADDMREIFELGAKA